MKSPGKPQGAGRRSDTGERPGRWARALALGPVLLALLGWSTPAEARRLALVIGNNAYPHIGRLEKAVGDADAVGRTLRTLGFDHVRVLRNADRWALRSAMRRFAKGLRPGDVAFLFFAGHGLRINGHNYLLATDMPYIPPRNITEQAVRLHALWVDKLRAEIQKAGARFAILVLDVCRNNPYRRGDARFRAPAPPPPRTRSYPAHDEVLDRGLRRRSARARGVFILYSAGIEEKALDALHVGERNPNSVFTRVLIRWMLRPGLALPDLADGVSNEVAALARRIGYNQHPAYYHELRGCFTFATGKACSRVAGWSGRIASLALPRLAPIPPIPPTPPRSEPPALDDCDRFAANPDDPNHHGLGMPYKAVGKNTGPAIVACQTAVEHWPREPRFRYQLARAYQASGNPAPAVALLSKLVEDDYVAAYDNLGWLYAEGRGGLLKDRSRALALFRRGAEKGLAEAMHSAGMLYWELHEYHQAAQWCRKALDAGYRQARKCVERLAVRHPDIGGGLRGSQAPQLSPEDQRRGMKMVIGVMGLVLQQMNRRKRDL